MTVTVTGLREVQRTLAALNDVTGQATVKSAFLDAADLVAVRARAKVPSLSGRAAASIRAGATSRGGYVKGGGGRVPYYGWLDFGTRNPRKGNRRKVGPWSGSGKGPKEGRFIYPALNENHDKVVELVAKGIESVIHRS